jgi:FtsH-binding integral membrane protein
MTALVTAVMGATGLMFPNFYRSIGGALFGALLALVVVSFARSFIPAIQGVGIIDYISAGIFSLYIGYDMYRASEIPATLDNAVDVAVSLYLDILNLFLDLLRIMGKSDD